MPHCFRPHLNSANGLSAQTTMNNPKLKLLVDLDQTLVYCTDIPKETFPSPPADTFYVESVRCFVNIRPYTEEFLESMARYYDMTVVTLARRPYAEDVVEKLDPEQKLFGGRIFSRDELSDPFSKTKNLDALFPEGLKQTAIIDDSVEVWDNRSNVVRVLPYCFVDENDDVLKHTERVLIEAHRRFHEHYRRTEELLDMELVFQELQEQVLQGETVVLAGFSSTEKADLIECLIRFGAVVRTKMSEQVTVVVAGRSTSEVVEAEKLEIPVVSRGWVDNVQRRWTKADFAEFALTVI